MFTVNSIVDSHATELPFCSITKPHSCLINDPLSDAVWLVSFYFFFYSLFMFDCVVDVIVSFT